MCLTYNSISDIVDKERVGTIYLESQTVIDLRDYYKGILFNCLNTGNQKGIDYFLERLHTFGVMRNG